jgi:LysM repeat protein
VVVLLAVVLLWGPAGAFAAPAAQGGVYVVQAGDTLSSIAARLGVSVSALARANGITNPNFVYVGQRLSVPGGSAPSSSSQPAPAGGTHVVRRGETLAGIAARYGVSASALAQANGLRNPNLIRVGQKLVIPRGSSAAPAPAPASQPAPAPGIHVVQRGETLAGIALRYGTTVAALMAANRLSNPNFIWVGQRLTISKGGQSSSRPAPVPAPTAGRWIDVNLRQQRLTAYQSQTPVFTTLISGGLAGTPTPVGRFSIRTKLTAQTMSGPGYWLPNVPYVMYFHAGYAIHGTYWYNNFGHPMSHGCVNLSTPAAAWLFSWASVGTPVVVHW